MTRKTLIVSNLFVPAAHLPAHIVENGSCMVHGEFVSPETTLELFTQNMPFEPYEFQYYLYEFIEGKYQQTEWYKKLFKNHFEDPKATLLRLTIVYNNDLPHTDESTKMKVLSALYELCLLFAEPVEFTFNTVRPVVKNDRFLNLKTMEHLIFDKFYLDSHYTAKRLRYLYRLVTK